MKPMTINDIVINFDERPKHKSVMAVKGVMNTALAELIDFTTLDNNMDMDEAIQAQLIENPGLITELDEIKVSLPIDQTIMLSTGMSYRELNELKDEMFEDEYIELFEKSKKALGGKTAADFLDIYPSNTPSL